MLDKLEEAEKVFDLDKLTPHEKYDLAVEILAARLIKFYATGNWVAILDSTSRDIFKKAFYELTVKITDET